MADRETHCGNGDPGSCDGPMLARCRREIVELEENNFKAFEVGIEISTSWLAVVPFNTLVESDSRSTEDVECTSNCEVDTSTTQNLDMI